MTTRRVAITLPDGILARADHWAHKQGKSRSRLVADLLDTALEDLSEQEATRLYDEAFASSEARKENQQLAEDLHGLVAPSSEDDQW